MRRLHELLAVAGEIRGHIVHDKPENVRPRRTGNFRHEDQERGYQPKTEEAFQVLHSGMLAEFSRDDNLGEQRVQLGHDLPLLKNRVHGVVRE